MEISPSALDNTRWDPSQQTAQVRPPCPHRSSWCSVRTHSSSHKFHKVFSKCPPNAWLGQKRSLTCEPHTKLTYREQQWWPGCSGLHISPSTMCWRHNLELMGKVQRKLTTYCLRCWHSLSPQQDYKESTPPGFPCPLLVLQLLWPYKFPCMVSAFSSARTWTFPLVCSPPNKSILSGLDRRLSS